MREVIFRGKPDGAKKSWVEGNLILFKTSALILEREDSGRQDYPYIDVSLGTIDGPAIPVTPQTVGQFTGLVDKNGKRIFEGDIVQTDKGRLYDVDMDRERCGWWPFACGDGCGCCEKDTVHPSECEVLGNIHDNPELRREG